MSVALVIPENWDAGLLVRWAVHFARAERTDLLILFVRRRSEPDGTRQLYPDTDAAKESGVGAIASALPEDFVWLAENHPDPEPVNDDDRDDRPPRHFVLVRRITHSNPAKPILNELGGATLLIVPRHASVRSRATEFEVERQLFRDAPCRTLQLRPGSDADACCERILVPAGNEEHSHLALDLAADLSEVCGGEFTALFVEPEVDEVSVLVGHRILDRIVGGAMGKNDRLKKKVVLADNVAAGIQLVAEGGFDLIIMSANYHGRVHGFLFRGVTERLITAQGTPPVAVIRRAMPLSSRFGRWLTTGARSLVPQLDREHRIALVERIQANSKWDFDFIALTCLSTLIAAMGLLQNSAAVVIGAMLVAPLMTPLLGAGLSVVQGNRILLKNTVGSVLLGFVLAFAIGLLVGFATSRVDPEITPSHEMLLRGSPGILDLLVALVSGIAAAYAIGRPNLLSALPGVAIAAALVPPIATAGLAMALSAPWLSFGATLLFLTNIVAIVLGTSFSLWLVGIRSAHEHRPLQKWSQWMAAALVVAVIVLATYESLPGALRKFEPAVKGYLRKASEFRFVSSHIDQSDVPPQVRIVLEGPSAATHDLVNEIAEIAQRNGLKGFQVEVETRIVVTTRDSNGLDATAITPDGGIQAGVPNPPP